MCRPPTRVYGFGDEQAVLLRRPLTIAAALVNSMDVGEAFKIRLFPRPFKRVLVGAPSRRSDKGRATLSSLDAFSSLEFAGALLVLPQMLQGH